MEIMWFILGIIFWFIEIITPTALISIWFIFGSIVAGILALLNVDTTYQLLSFISCSILCLLLFRPLLKKYFTPKLTKTNADRLIGKKYHLDDDYYEKHWGLLNINGITWNVESVDLKPINKGELVEIVNISGSKLIVRKEN